MNNYFVFEGRLDSLNDYIRANRTNAQVGNRMKQLGQAAVGWNIIQYKQKGLLKPVTKSCRVKFTFYEKTQKRDIDNVTSFATKVILDALVKMQILPDDNRKYITQLQYDFAKADSDKILVELEEIE